MSNLQLSYPDIPYNCTAISASAPIYTDQTVWDIVAGERYNTTNFYPKVTSGYYTFDLGPAYATKNASADHFILSRASVALVKNGTTAKLQRSDDGSTYVDVCDSSSVGAMYGPLSADFFAAFAEAGPYRYWRVALSHAAAQYFTISKAYFGKLLNFTMDPDYKCTKITPDSVFYASAGGAYQSRNVDPYWRVELTWPAQTDAIAALFEQKVINVAREAQFFLVNTTRTQILDGQGVLNVELVKADISKDSAGRNTITAIFNEVVA